MRNIDRLCVNTIRVLSAECVEKARSGHPGMPMGAATMAYVLWSRFLRHNPANPTWPDRDRFVLSAGHGSMILYSLLHLTGYGLSLEELQHFRQWGSKTPGHPEYLHTPGVETTTGPLGQGFANGVGMAIAERHLAAYFNRSGFEIVNHHIYGIVSDGDLMEGISHEAASLAGHLKLGKIIYLYDDNGITIDGPTNLSFTEDRIGRFSAYGWHVQQVEDGDDMESLEKALREAQAEGDRPSLIAVRTHIGYGSPHKQDSSAAHGEPLGEEELRLTKKNLGWPPEPEFFIPEEALRRFRQALDEGRELERSWMERVSAYRRAYPRLGQEWELWMRGRVPEGWDRDIPYFDPGPKGMATREASGFVLNAIAPYVSNLLGGSADLSPSNKTMIEGVDDFQGGRYGGRNFHFGVREHGMGGILNGMALHGGLIPYGGTFLIFSDYMRPAIRLAAMMGLRVIYIFTHDSIGLGEDGPTHQPIEQIACLRAIPYLAVIRPCDANETAEAWRVALTSEDRPTALILSRQGLPILDRSILAPATGLSKGAYVLWESREGRPDIILIASGSEVPIALESARMLQEKGSSVRVVSMPSWELFEQQPETYRKEVLPPDIRRRVAIEAGVPLGWNRYVGDKGEIIGIERFGASSPYKVLYEKLGITVEHVVERALKLLGRDEDLAHEG